MGSTSNKLACLFGSILLGVVVLVVVMVMGMVPVRKVCDYNQFYR